MRKSLSQYAAIGVAGIAAAVGPSAGADAQTVIDATYVVDSSGLDDDATLGDGTCATSAGECTLTAALQEADATTGLGAVIVSLPSGTFTLNQPVDIGRRLIVEGADRDATTIDLDDRAGLHVERTAVTLRSVEVTGGLAVDGNGGSVVNAIDADVTIEDARLADNRADGDGGAIWMVGGSLNITGSELQRNSGQLGGAAFVARGTVDIADTTFTQNGASASGGALYLSFVEALSITDSTFVENVAVQQGGAVYISGLAGTDPTAMTISGSAFDENLAGRDGGAIFVGDLSNRSAVVALVIDGSTFVANSSQVGGAIAIHHGMVALHDAEFDSNVAAEGSGGAIANGGSVEVATSTFTSNSATESGGAIASNGPTTVSASTFEANSAEVFGGALNLFGEPTPVVTASVFTGNEADIEGGAMWRSGDDLTQSSNQFSDNLPAGDPVVLADVPVAPAVTPPAPPIDPSTTPATSATTNPATVTTGTPVAPTAAGGPGASPSTLTSPSETPSGSMPATGTAIAGVLGLATALVVTGIAVRRSGRRSGQRSRSA